MHIKIHNIHFSVIYIMQSIFIETNSCYALLKITTEAVNLTNRAHNEPVKMYSHYNNLGLRKYLKVIRLVEHKTLNMLIAHDSVLKADEKRK